MTLDVGAMRRTWSSYAGAPTVTRAFVLARLVVAPLGPLADEIRPLRGRIASLGSGISVIERYVSEGHREVEFVGIDLDPRRVALIEKTRHRSPRVSVRLGDATELDERDAYDGVLVCDALHHFTPETHKPVAVSIARALKPGGVCIVKDLDVAPSWKHEWNRLHDRIVAGPEPIHCRAPDEMAEIFASAGLVPERVERIEHRLTPYAHYLVRVRKPADGPGADGQP
jgi:SAM-dependent methyltransferase